MSSVATPLRVLVVAGEDEDCLRASMMLHDAGSHLFEVECASGLSDAVAALATHRADAVLVHEHMGEVSGFEMLNDFVPPQSVPVILITEDEGPDVAELVAQAGAADYFPRADLSPAFLKRCLRYVIERSKADKQLHRVARYDTVTGIPNRRFFWERLKDALELQRQTGTFVAVLFVDLEGFKGTNNRLGHAAGDQLLRAVATRLTQAISPNDSVSRYGDDEFAVIVEGLVSMDDAQIVAQKILDVLHPTYSLNQDGATIGVNIGIAVAPQDATDAELLAERAEAAMHRAKEEGSNRYEFYCDLLVESAESRRSLRSKLKRALGEKEFELHYQPQIDRNGAFVGVEALLRWRRDGKLIYPNAFVPILEQSNFVCEVGEWVIRAACEEVNAWHVPVRVAVNVSARQFQSHDISRTVQRLLRETGLAPDRLELELTETLVMEDTLASIAALRSLKDMGVRISIDDFGTGYSSLAYLRKLPVDIVKVDRAFVMDIPHQDDGTIASAIIALGHSLGLHIVAEGVETHEQYEFLRARGCDAFQGYLFARPMPAPECRALIEQRKALACA